MGDGSDSHPTGVARIWAINAVFVTVGLGYLVWRILAGGQGAGADFLNTLGVTAVFALAVQMGYSLWGATVLRRAAAVRNAFPDAVVLTALKTRRCASALNKVAPQVAFPTVLFLTADSKGIGIRRYDLDPEPLIFDWASVTSLSATTFVDYWRSSNGISLRIVMSVAEVELPFVTIGRGLAGLYPLERVKLDAVVARLQSLRQPL